MRNKDSVGLVRITPNLLQYRINIVAVQLKFYYLIYKFYIVFPIESNSKVSFIKFISQKIFSNYSRNNSFVLNNNTNP